MSDLATLQHLFQTELLGAQSEFSAQVAVEHLDRPAHARIAIYRDAYRIRLREALASNYPQLKRWLGTEAFEAIADAYIETHPSHHPSIRWFGDLLPAALSRSLPSQPWISELARWDWAMSIAFDAGDCAPLDRARLGELSAEQWPNLQFGFHPSVRSLALRTNAPMLYKAISEEQTIPAPSQTDEMHWLVWRQDLAPRYRSLQPNEAAALQAVLSGSTFEAMCTALCKWDSAEDVPLLAAGMLREWFEAQMICTVTHA